MNTNSTVVLLQQKNISDKGSTMTKNNLSQRHFLEQNNAINNLFEHLLQQLRSLGYPETRLWINVARQSFEHELLTPYLPAVHKNGRVYFILKHYPV